MEMLLLCTGKNKETHRICRGTKIIKILGFFEIIVQKVQEAREQRSEWQQEKAITISDSDSDDEKIQKPSKKQKVRSIIIVVYNCQDRITGKLIHVYFTSTYSGFDIYRVVS